MAESPSFLKNAAQVPRRYNGRLMTCFKGEVKLSDIDGWVSNPRIELQSKVLKDKLGRQDLDQNDIFELMKQTPEIKLKMLRDDIQKNGLREPLVLSYKGQLLDGNRRFFATKYLLETMKATDVDRQDFETVEAFVLLEKATTQDIENVITHENFAASHKIPWDFYTMAQKISDGHRDGLTHDQLAKKYAWAKAKVKETIKISAVIDDFLAWAIAAVDPQDEYSGLGLSQTDAEILASKNYQYFNEAVKSFHSQLQSDINFKLQFFVWINQGKFNSFQQTRVAHKVWMHPEAKGRLMENSPDAAKAAMAVLDQEQYLAKATKSVSKRVQEMIVFLETMNTQELSSISHDAIVKLEKSLKLVLGLISKKNDEDSVEENETAN